jgi:hypothetical protein
MPTGWTRRHHKEIAMNTMHRYLIAALAVASTTTIVAAQGRGRALPPVTQRSAASTLTAEQMTQLRALRERQQTERRALAEKHREAIAKIAPQQVRRVQEQRGRGRGPQVAPPRGRGPQVQRGPDVQRGPQLQRGPQVQRGPQAQRGAQMQRGPQVQRGPQMQRGVMVVPPQLGRGPAGPVIQGRPLPPRRGGDDNRRGPQPPPRDRR